MGMYVLLVCVVLLFPSILQAVAYMITLVSLS